MRRLLIAFVGVSFALGLAGCSAVISNNNIHNVANSNTTPAAKSSPENANAAVSVNASDAATNSNTNSSTPAAFVSPLDNPVGRITKKFFGMYITPTTSPVQPERFTGYHTGVDFETYPSEATVDVPVVAACTGKVRARQYVSGYGGVLVQDCAVAGQTVTALYGHLRLSSISVKVGATLKTGAQIAVLGTGNSSETDGERKHLHFSLHKGTAIVWKGYVSSKAALGDWLDPQKYL